jgi:hypothetical protein
MRLGGDADTLCRLLRLCVQLLHLPKEFYAETLTMPGQGRHVMSIRRKGGVDRTEEVVDAHSGLGALNQGSVALGQARVATAWATSTGERIFPAAVLHGSR